MVLNIHWKDWCWNWNSNTLASWCEEPTHWKRPWYWERLKVGEEGDNRGWDGWMASPTLWTWVWASCRSWKWTGKPGMLQSMGSKRVRHNWVTELNWIIKESWNKKEPQRSLRSKSHVAHSNIQSKIVIPGPLFFLSSNAFSPDSSYFPHSLSCIGHLSTCPPTYHPFDPLNFLLNLTDPPPMLEQTNASFLHFLGSVGEMLTAVLIITT